MGKCVSFFVLSFLFLISGKAVDAKKNGSAVYVKYANEIICSFAKEMKAEFNLLCSGSGGKMPYDVEIIEVGFTAYRNATIEEARELEVKVTEKLREKINQHEKIRPFLREYPFPASRAKVKISFSKKDGSRPKEGFVALTFHAKDTIFYDTATNETEKLVSLAEEPYEEALKIVQKKAVKL